MGGTRVVIIVVVIGEKYIKEEIKEMKVVKLNGVAPVKHGNVSKILEELYVYKFHIH